MPDPSRPSSPAVDEPVDRLLRSAYHHAERAETLSRLRTRFAGLSAGRQPAFLERLDDETFREIARSANQLQIIYAGNRLARLLTTASPQVKRLLSTVEETVQYRDAFNHPESLQTPRLEWNAFPLLSRQIDTELHKAANLLETRASGDRSLNAKQRAGFRKQAVASREIAQAIAALPVADPTANDPALVLPLLDAAITFHDIRTGAFIGAANARLNDLQLSRMAGNEGPKPSPLHLGRDFIQQLTLFRSQMGHRESGSHPPIASRMGKRVPSPSFQLKQALLQRGAEIGGTDTYTARLYPLAGLDPASRWQEVVKKKSDDDLPPH